MSKFIKFQTLKSQDTKKSTIVNLNKTHTMDIVKVPLILKFNIQNFKIKQSFVDRNI